MLFLSWGSSLPSREWWQVTPGLKNSFYGGIPLGILGYISNETFQLLGGASQATCKTTSRRQQVGDDNRDNFVMRNSQSAGGKNHWYLRWEVELTPIDWRLAPVNNVTSIMVELLLLLLFTLINTNKSHRKHFENAQKRIIIISLGVVFLVIIYGL